MNYQKNIKKIYDEIFKIKKDQKINIFLCGGASSKKHLSLRDQIREKINNKYSNIRILYPEDLFMELLAREPNFNLLELENFLASNSDLIFLICESPGSLVELGAFCNHVEIKKKLIVAIEEKYKRSKSFIMLGPIKSLQKMNDERVIFYNENIDKLTERLTKLNKKSYPQKKIDSIIGLYEFLALVLFFFDSMDLSELEKSIKNLFIDLNLNIDNFKLIYSSAIRLNFKEKIIKKSFSNSSKQYTLTELGYQEKKKEISNNLLICDRIRLEILNDRFY